MLRYYRTVAETAFFGAYARVRALGLALSIAGWLIAPFIPGLAGNAGGLVAAVSLGLLGGLAAFRLVLAPYWLARSVSAATAEQLASAQAEAANLRAVRDERLSVAVALLVLSERAAEGEDLADRIRGGLAGKGERETWVTKTQTDIIERVGISAVAEMSSAAKSAFEEGRKISDAQAESDATRAIVACIHRYSEQIRLHGLPPNLPHG